ncbi:MAG: FG-GAP repeat domain-containing protein, partial [Candidatus Dojkabacteria bacterium]
MKYSSLVIFTVFFLAFSSFLSIQNIQAASFASGNQIYSNQIQFSFGQGAYGDIDNDGDLDIVGQTLGYFPSILYNVNGTISNSEQDHLPPERGFYYGSTLGDLDGDGDLEYITAGPNGADDSPNIVYYYDNVNERYERVGTTYEIANLAFYGYAVEVGDFVEDGKPDVLWFGPDDAILGVNSTTTADNITFSSISSVGSINRTEWGNDTTATGDFNGDGHLDFILVDDESGAGGTYQIGYGDGAGNFSIFSDGGVGDTRTAYKMDVGDFNSDGRDDFVLLRADLANDDSEVRLYVRNSANDGFDV